MPESTDRIRRWRECRWLIAEPRLLPTTGTRIEDRRLDDADDSKSHERVFMVCHELLQLRVIRTSAPPGYVPDLGMIAIDLRRYARFSHPGASPCQERKDSGTPCNRSRSQRPP